MCVDLVLLDEGSAKSVDNPHVESAEHLHLDEVVGQQQ
jgi:hypothetical protein